MALYGLLADVHLTHRPPVSVQETYLPDLMNLLDQGFTVFRSRQAAAAVIAGDLFHLKAPGRTPHSLVRELGRRFRAQPFPVWVVPGNHDLTHDSMSSLPGQPLGVLFGVGAAHCLDGWMGGEHPVFGVPWQQRWSADGIAEALRPYREQVYEAGPGAQRPLVVTHAPIYPPGSEPRYEGAEFTPADWWAAALDRGSGGHCVFYGHIHEPHGAWERGGVRFCNNGALSRGSLDEHNLTRPVGVTVWDSETGEIEFVALSARPAEQVFRLRERDRVVTAQHRLDAFLTEIGQVTLPRLTPDTVMEHVRRANPGPEAVELAGELVEWASHERKPR